MASASARSRGDSEVAIEARSGRRGGQGRAKGGVSKAQCPPRISEKAGELCVLPELALFCKGVMGCVAELNEMEHDALLQSYEVCRYECESSSVVRGRATHGSEVLKDEEVWPEAETNVVFYIRENPFGEAMGGHARREGPKSSGVHDGVEGVEGRVQCYTTL